MSLPKRVFLTEVGPRDGLQNEQQPVPVDIKVGLCERLLAAGVGNLEATSFVSPKWVPQMADAAQVMARIPRPAGVTISVLTPNIKGFEGALAAKADEVVIFGAASEAFSHRNINCSIEESINRFTPVANAAKANGLRLRAAVSVAFGCPYQGEVPVSSVVDVVKRFRDMGCDEIGIADTIGVANAEQVKRVLEAAAREYPLDQISGHFHDTYGQAIANVYASLQVGVSRFDASIAGLGGCPYAKGATGNVATEDVLYLLDALGIETGISLEQMVDAGQWISAFLGRKSMSRAGNALHAKKLSREEKAQAA
ncbi:MAG: hydroxymethylglutaryl-CoA lyase [Betaproteobacteria bacterium]|nr:hydroxymethylglutaryl-CoA lyase [Betaproteobacteria bacterium]